MIGTDPNLDLPDPSGDTFADIVSKLVVALETLGDSVAERATPAALNINTAFNLGGNALTNVTSVQFVEGNNSQTAGSIFFFEGDFYAVDTVGIIKLTDNGAINVASVGGIVGDYGGINPASVYFDDSSEEYRFFDDGSTGAYADLVADDVVLKGTNGEIRLSVDDAITTSRTVNFKSLPTSGVSLLVYDPSDNSIKDNAVTAADNQINGANIYAGVDYKHGSTFRKQALFGPALVLSNCGLSATTNLVKLVSSGAGWSWRGPDLPLRSGDRIQTVGVYVSTAVAGDISVYLIKQFNGAETQYIIQTFNPGTTAGSYAAAMGAPVAIADGETWSVRVDGASSGVHLTSYHYTWDHP